MSVRALSRVWDASTHGGTELLMLLAIADFADDDGRAYPAVAKLAKKCRTTPRHANRLLAALRDSGELEIRLNAGEHGQNRYRILFAAIESAQRTPDAHVTPDPRVTLTPASATPDVDVPKPLTCASDKPSLNRQDPSGTSLSRPTTSKFPNCPHDLIVQSYHDVLPELPRVKLMDSKGRKAKIADFWKWVLTSTKSDGAKRAANAAEALAWIHSYFERARANDFLMGRSNRTEAHSTWRCDFDFLLTEKGKKQVIEKTEAAA